MIRTTSFCCLLLVSLCLFAQSPKLMIPAGHSDAITHIFFSPDGKRIATGSKDKTIKLWDTNTGKLLADLKGHSGEIKSLSFNAAGDRLLSTATLDSNAFLWNMQTGALVKALHTRSYIDQAIFSPDGRWAFINTSGEQPFLYNSKTGTPEIELKTWNRYIDAAAFSPDSKKLLSSNGEVWNTETGEQLFKLKGGKLQMVHFNPNGQQIITGNFEKVVQVWDTSGKLQFELKGHTDYLKSFWFSPDGKRLATATGHTTFAKLWDLEKGALIADLKGNDYYLTALSFSADSKIVLTTGNNGIAKMWDAATGQSKSKGISDYSKFATFHNKENRHLITKGEKIYLIDNNTETTLAIMEGTKSLSVAAFHPAEPKTAGVGDNQQSAIIWHNSTGKKLVELKGFSEEIKTAHLAIEGQQLVTQTYNKAAFWGVANGLIQPSKASFNNSAVLSRYSPDRRSMVVIQEGEKERIAGLWDANTFQPISKNLSVKGVIHSGNFYDHGYLFSDDSKKLLQANQGLRSYVRDAKTGELLKTIQHGEVSFHSINSTGTRIATYGSEGIEIFDTENSTSINKFAVTAYGYQPVAFTGVKNRFLLFNVDEISLYEEGGSQPILHFTGGRYEFNKAKTKLLVTTMDTIRIWDLAKAKQEFYFIKPKDSVYYTAFWDVIWSPDEQSIIYSLNKKEIKKIDLANKAIQADAPHYAKSLILSDDKRLLFCIADDVVTVLNSHDLKTIATLKGHDNLVVSAMRMADTTKLLTVAKDNTARVWELATGKLIYTYLLLDKELQLSLLPSGYYQSNQAASKMLYYIDDNLRPISFEQLDVKYNRPDLVLKALNYTDTALISAYEKAYVKRIRRLGIDTTAFKDGYAIPNADFADRNTISYEQTKGGLKLHIKAADSAYTLDRFNLWINESPLFGSKGISLKGSKRKVFDTTFTITLSQGINNLETSVTNSSGTESYRMPLTVAYTPSQPAKEKVHFVGIGIDHFKDKKYDLNYSVKDIRDLALKLGEKYGSDIVIDTLFDQAVSAESVAALKKRLLSTSIDDKVIIAYSGHGLLSKNYDYYLSTYKVNFLQPEQGGLPYEALESLVDGIPARKKLLLIDACHSGEVDKEEMQRLKKGTASLKEKGTTTKGVEDDEYSNSKLGMKNSFELMQELFVNVGRTTGATVISAAGGTQFAQERDELKNGVFTYSILELIKSRKEVTVSELKDHVNKRVTELTNGLQVPTTRSETKVVDWKVW